MPRKVETESTAEQFAVEMRTRYGDVIAAAEAARAAGDHERADELAGTAQRIIDMDRAQAVAQAEQDSYARNNAPHERTDTEE